MTLEVHIGTLVPSTWGFTRAGGAWPAELNRSLGVDEGDAHILAWALDTESMIGRSENGHSVALSPFMGVLGMPPAEPGVHPTAPPRASGGNIDTFTAFLPPAPGSGRAAPQPAPPPCARACQE